MYWCITSDLSMPKFVSSFSATASLYLDKALMFMKSLYVRMYACHICTYTVPHTVYVEHLANIKFGDLGANTGWLTFSLVNQLSS